MKEVLTANPPECEVSLWEIARVFLIIGTIGFGGGMAVITLIQDYVVSRRRWMKLDEFTHGIALGQILGPFAVNSSIFVGYRLRGLKGAVVAALSFLAPSIIMVIILSILYDRFHQIPLLQAALKGMGPVVVALILAAAYKTGRGHAGRLEPWLLMVAAVALSLFLKFPIVLILLSAAAYGFLKLKMAQKGGEHESP
jgi:chromate transporter